MAEPYSVRFEPNIPLALRDGTTTYVDLFRPDAAGRFPGLLQRTPYDKSSAQSRGGTIDPIYSERSVQRVTAEKAWAVFGDETGVAVHLFRLAGIYGPGRGPFERVRQGKARRIVKPDQVFNRIHVEDIANVLEASIAHPRGGAIYNVSDNEPAPPQDVVAHASRELGMEPPPEVAFEDAGLSPMGRSFYGENKRVSNARIRQELKVALSYPTYREGMRYTDGASGK